MKLAFLKPLYARQGPIACAYVDTSRDIEDPDHAIELRWRQLRRELENQGADPATTTALDEVVGTDGDVPGPHGQAVFAAHGQLILAQELPEPPARDRARYSVLPDAMPLALQRAPDIPYAAVAVRYLLESERAAADEDLEVELQNGHWPTSRIGGGERDLRRLPAGRWRLEADGMARRLMELVDRGEAEVIVIAGDVWGRGVLVNKLPKRLRDRIIAMDAQAPVALPGRALLEQELENVFRWRMTELDRARLEMFLARRAGRGGTAEGLMAVVDALRRGQVEALLINDAVSLGTRLWVGTAAKQIGLSENELHAHGVQHCWEEPADTALIRAVVGTGAELIVVPSEELPLADGVGALLRFSDAAT